MIEIIIVSAQFLNLIALIILLKRISELEKSILNSNYENAHTSIRPFIRKVSQ